MDRVVAVPDPSLDARYPAAWPSWVRIVLSGGRTLEARVDHPRGDPENFPSPAELDAKFRTLAGRALGAGGVARLAAEIDALSAAPSVVSLLAAAVPTVS
jgi:2-methylcitrate dehydratase PrpD